MPQTGNGNGVSGAGETHQQSDQAAAALPELDRTHLGTINVLVAVEDMAVLEVCAEQLRADGFAVTACARAEDALEVFRRRPFEMAVLDVEPSREAASELLRSVAAGTGSTRAVLLADQPLLVTARFHDRYAFQPTLLYRIDTGWNPAPTVTHAS